jgi:hypothetical protein
MHRLIRAFLFVILVDAGAVIAAPAVGDAYVYRVINAYSHEVRGQLTYQVDNINAGQTVYSVVPDRPSLGLAHTEVITNDGNWLRHPLINHDMEVEYSFSPPLPAYAAPLDAGKSWSARVSATNAAGRRNSVRVDGDVIGRERVTTPAGTFDTVKVKRRVYAGDWEAFTMETNIVVTDWYAPALGRPVKTERNSGYIDSQKCGRASPACSPVRGDWDIFELVSYVGK